METVLTYAFDQFPRCDLSLKLDRRQVLFGVATQFRVRQERSRGKATYRLSELGSLTDEQVAPIAPMMVPGLALLEHQRFLWADHPSPKRRVRLFPLESPARLAFDRFDGQTLIDTIAGDLAVATGGDKPHAFAYVRGLFLHLVTLGICVPR